MQLEIWSDIACPWCAIGKRHLEAALDGLPHRDDVQVRWRSFQLDPAAPAVQEGGYAARLAAKYGTGVEQAQRMLDQMTERAAAVGWTFRFDRIRTGNTFDAHRLLHLAADRGRQDAVKERFLRGHFTDGAAIGDHDALRRLAVEAGLDDAEVAAVLASNRYADAVAADLEQAAAYGIRGVPFFVLDRRYAVEGAQPPEVLRRAVEQADATTRAPAGGHADRHVHEHPDGASCAGDACAV